MIQPTRSVDYGKMLYESLRNYYSVNKAGNLTYLYLFCAACVATMQDPFNTYYTARVTNILVAQCAWQVGQLTNVLNYLFDPVSKRIYIGQSVSLAPVAPEFGSVTPLNIPEFGGVSTPAFREFGDHAYMTGLIFYVPTALAADVPAITAIIAQIALTGISYTIQLF